MSELEEITPALREVLIDMLELDEPDMEDPLHVKLVETLRRLGPYASRGRRNVALRFDFNWELKRAGEEYADAKVAYEKFLDRETVELRSRAVSSGESLSRIEAEQIARASDRAYALHLKYLRAEQRERAMRKFLETLGADLDNHRTDRADQREVDKASAHGYAGGA